MSLWRCLRPAKVRSGQLDWQSPVILGESQLLSNHQTIGIPSARAVTVVAVGTVMKKNTAMYLSLSRTTTQV